MVYPGNSELSGQAQERVMTAFRQVVSKLQDGQREAAMIGLEFVLRLDPAFAPAINLQRQLTSGAAEIDLSDIISQLQAPSTDAINELLVEAVDEFNQRRFLAAKEKVGRVLADLPGHPEARQLAKQIQDALKVEAQVGQFLAQAREALDTGDPQEAANFVMMAQALDPHHPGIDAMLAGVRAAGGTAEHAARGAAPPIGDEDDLAVSFATLDEGDAGFAADLAAANAAPDFSEPSRSERSVGDFFSEPPATGAGGGEFGLGGELDPEGSLSDLFDAAAAPAAATAEPEAAPAPPGDDARRIEQLLNTGQQAFDREDFQEAIDAWSRIYLIDPSHELAQQRIDEARQRKEELDRRIEHMLYDAQEAASRGDLATAKSLVGGVLSLQPNHLQAIELREEIGSRAPEGAAAPAMPDLEDDLFEEAFPVNEAIAGLALENEAPTAIPSIARPSRRELPLRPILLGLAGVLVVLVGVWFGSQLLGSRSAEDQTEALNRALTEAEALFKQGRVEEAIVLLQEFPATGLDQTRIAKRLARYQQAMAPPTPTPIPELLVSARLRFEEGQFAAAYWDAMEGLKSHPQDTDLLDLRSRILDLEPRIGTLYNQMSSGEMRAAVPIARDLVAVYPESEHLGTVLERALFNGALAELRAYNLTGGEVMLRELSARRPEDEVVTRTLELIEKYKSRPADPLMETYIASLAAR